MSASSQLVLRVLFERCSRSVYSACQETKSNRMPRKNQYTHSYQRKCKYSRDLLTSVYLPIHSNFRRTIGTTIGALTSCCTLYSSSSMLWNWIIPIVFTNLTTIQIPVPLIIQLTGSPVRRPSYLIGIATCSRTETTSTVELN